jgi:hypothetical protein
MKALGGVAQLPDRLNGSDREAAGDEGCRIASRAGADVGGGRRARREKGISGAWASSKGSDSY